MTFWRPTFFRDRPHSTAVTVSGYNPRLSTGAALIKFQGILGHAVRHLPAFGHYHRDYSPLHGITLARPVGRGARALAANLLPVPRDRAFTIRLGVRLHRSRLFTERNF